VVSDDADADTPGDVTDTDGSAGASATVTTEDGSRSASSTPPVVALVLAGGTGTRLYPASRSTRPKQFLPLLGDGTLLERTVSRAAFADHVVVSTRPAFEPRVRELVPDADVVVEPAAKDTGPALAYATHRIAERYGDCVVVVLPSDHHVADDDAFAAALARGARLASESGRLVAFGVEPTRPETGYGYIEPGRALDTGTGTGFELAAFHEKPDAETATRYVDEGYLWNAGTFAWTPRAFRDAALDSPLAPLVEALADGRVAAGFDAVEPTSVDYAVMERVADAAVVPLDVAWDDLGSWDALRRLLVPDADGNVVHRSGAHEAARGTAETTADTVEDGESEGEEGGALFVDSRDNVVVSDGPHVSVAGVDGLAVVAWDDRVLVVPAAEAQRVRAVVSRLREQDRF
jgi:mannose-1-phosphate guanylyltransferase